MLDAASKLGLKDQAIVVRFSLRNTKFSFFKYVQTITRGAPSLMSAIFSRLKLSGHEAGHSYIYSADVKNERFYIFSSP